MPNYGSGTRLRQLEASKHAIHGSTRASLVVAGIVGAMVTQFLAIPGAWAKEDQKVIAATGSPAPKGGNFFRFLSLTMNEHGEVAFDALLLGTSRTGIFAWDGKATSVIALGGNSDPASGDFGSVRFPAIDSHGSVVFQGDAGLFRGDVTSIVPIMQDGERAPGGGTLVGPPSVFSSNSRGTVVFLTGTAGTDSTQGVFLRNGDQTVAIARDNGLSPLGGTFLFFGDPAMGGGRRVAFFAGVTDGSGDFGIFRADGDEGIATLFGTNQPAPGGATFLDFSGPVINERGQVAATALLANGLGPSGLFRSDGKEIAIIALEGVSAPDGGRFNGFLKPLTINDRGEVAFPARLAGGTSRGGIFRGDGRTTTTIALLGTTAPGTTGTFSSFRDMKLADDGTVAFIATLTTGVGGVDGTNSMGIWSGTSGSDLRLVVRTSDLIESRTLTSLPSGFGLFGISERSVAWLGGFAGSSAAIVVSQIGDHEKETGEHER